ncbi:MAG: hypothetical protein Tsb0014_16960 [Pleurocapsa sp.]
MKRQKSYQRNFRQPRFRWTIARKISSLATVLILFILIVIIYSIFALKNIRGDLQEIAQLDVPLTEISNAIEIHQLEQQIALDELLRLELENNQTIVRKRNQLEQKFLENKTQLIRQIERGIVLSDRGINSKSPAKFSEINNSLLALQKEGDSLNKIVENIIKTLDNNNYPDAETVNQLLAKDELFDRHAINLITAIENFTARRIAIAEKHERTFFLVNIGLGIAGILLGILLSLIIIVSIKSNLLHLSKKMSEVRQAIAQKQKIVPTATLIDSNDEIGELAQELSKTIENFSEEIHQRDRLSQHLKQMATTDKLTGAFNRLKWDEALTDEIDRVKRSKQDLSLIIFDIDHFKKINDTYGHDVGDVVLIEVVKIAKELIRKTDSLYRIGGEEFTILAPYTDCDRVLILAERVRRAIDSHIFEKVERVTISMGVTQFQESDEAKQFVKRADTALYQSKQGGRNQVNYL